MNYVAKTIGWCDYTINPIKGLCRGGCWYCYDRPRQKRFKLDRTPRLDLSVFEAVRKRKKPARIFVCSTHELFGDWIPDEWIQAIIEEAAKCPQHVFQFLTKNPGRTVQFKLPANAWVGVTVTKPSEYSRFYSLVLQPNIRFISFEPLLADIGEVFPQDWEYINLIIIGPLSLPGGRTQQPRLEWVKSLLRQADRYDVPVYMKNNLLLRPLFGLKALRQEIPNG